MTEKTMREIIGFDVDVNDLPDDVMTSNDPKAVKYRVALIRASNAIEGVILTDEEKAFMDNIPMDLPKEERVAMIVNYFRKG